jgi:myo-inositol-1(or 4)-monophosphatase
MTMSSTNFKKTLIEALHTGGGVIMNYFSDTIAYTVKENQSSIVTEADCESERSICSVIETSFPDHSIVSEESGYQKKESRYTWVIDPLDGTSNYWAGLPWFGIIIAVLEEQTPVLGGVYIPPSEELYLAEYGRGAFCNDSPIGVSREDRLENVLVSYSLDYSPIGSLADKKAAVYRNLIQSSRNVRSLNCVVELCYVADGRLGGCINYETKLWDIAAPALIVQEAGGVVTDLSGKQLQFDLHAQSFEKNYPVIVASRGIHRQLCEQVNPR